MPEGLPNYVTGEFCPANWLTRQQVATILRVSYRTVQNLEARGVLTPKQSRDGYWCHDPAVVRALADTYRPRAGGRSNPYSHLRSDSRDGNVLELIRKGIPVADIVIMLKIPLDTVHRIWEKSTLDLGDPGYVYDGVLEEKARKERALLRARTAIETKTIELQTALVSGKAPRKKKTG
jgi:hypothetical protein